MFLLGVFSDDPFIFLGRAVEADAQAFAPGQDRMAETDGELFNLDADPLGGQEVAELVEEDDEPKSEDKSGDGENVGQSHRAVPSKSIGGVPKHTLPKYGGSQSGGSGFP